MDRIANSLAERLLMLEDGNPEDMQGWAELAYRLIDCPTEEDCLEAIDILSVV